MLLSLALSTMSTVQDTQPGAVDSPSVQKVDSALDSSKRTLQDRLTATKSKFTTKNGWLGSYDYAWLCMPALPFTKAYNQRSPPFYALHDDLPLLLAAGTGLQHALAMLAGKDIYLIILTHVDAITPGLITPPIIFASALNLDADTSSYMISASLIGCGRFLALKAP